MYCPQCGQAQVSDEIRFCSRCGFPLTEVSDVLARQGVPVPPPPPHSPIKSGLKQGGMMALAVLVLMFSLLIANAQEEPSLVLVGLGFAAAFLRVVFGVLIHLWKTRHTAPAQLAPPVHRAPASLPPVGTGPVVVPPRARFDTGEVEQPPSVTEHTTRHLEQERQREPEL
jgi:hypothetical protein